MKDIKKYPFLIIFTVFMMVMFAADLMTTRKQYSELENRKLAQKPTMTFESVFNNKYSKKYEEYINDQFVGRNLWISTKSFGEMLFCKVENNGGVYGKDDYIFGKETSFDKNQITSNIAAVNRFAEIMGGNVHLGIIPNSFEILTDKLPVGLEYIAVDQAAEIKNIHSKLKNIKGVDMYTPLLSHNNEYIFYRTDHHWTTLGAYYGYESIANALGFAPVELNSLEPIKHTVEDFYGTYFNKTKNFNAVPDTITYYDVPVDSITIDGKNTILSTDKKEVVLDNLYEESKWATRDKYAAFLYGNNGLTIVKNKVHENPEKATRLLLFKDSYSNSLVPYLTYNYDEIYICDLRAITPDSMKLVKDTEFTDILFLYNFESFQSEKTFFKLTM